MFATRKRCFITFAKWIRLWFWVPFVYGNEVHNLQIASIKVEIYFHKTLKLESKKKLKKIKNDCKLQMFLKPIRVGLSTMRLYVHTSIYIYICEGMYVCTLYVLGQQQNCDWRRQTGFNKGMGLSFWIRPSISKCTVDTR